ncbi:MULTISPECIES: DUF934 domain-containing protein [Rhodomicrobium]|uniref:DUF934 domain-containing protein n=1 Tax=Rhodomicrobium TaxID=1068 RepID=UPI000B4A5D0C|nr:MULTISPECIES: DUF934 domain-containing protein [Rhodomicrobium]
MPLIKDGHFVADDWSRPVEGEPAVAGAKLILAFARLEAEASDLIEAGHAVGVEITNDTDPAALEPWFDRLALIVVPFPRAADGRGFSIATRLRRLGYRGELRASGHLIADQYTLARSCGFDTVEISDAQAARQPEPHWLEAEHAMSLAYQRGYGPLRNILGARWAAQ